MHNITRDGRARESFQERRIEKMHMGLTQFLERCDPAHLAASRPFDAPAANTPSTPSTPTGVPSRLRPDFDFESPVNQDKSTAPTRNIDPCITHPRNRDYNDARDTRIQDHNDSRDTRNRDHHDARDPRDHDQRSEQRPPIQQTAHA